MAENENAPEAGASTGGEATGAAPAPEQAQTEEITYHAVEKDGQVTAIWEMQGRKHLRTIYHSPFALYCCSCSAV